MQVKKKQVASFKPGRTPPGCSLLLKYVGSEHPPDFEHRLCLSGTTSPDDFITILSELVSPCE